MYFNCAVVVMFLDAMIIFGIHNWLQKKGFLLSMCNKRRQNISTEFHAVSISQP